METNSYHLLENVLQIVFKHNPLYRLHPSTAYVHIALAAFQQSIQLNLSCLGPQAHGTTCLLRPICI